MKRSRLKDWRWWLGLAPKHLKFPPPSGDITILVPAFNEAKSIGLTILSLLRQTRTPDRIIVIDDCSTDGTGDIARQFGVEVLRTPQNSGTKAQAINFALPFVRTEYVCVVDGDTLLKRDALEKILPAFHDDRVVAACGYVIPQKIRTFWERARFIEYIFSLSIYKRAQNHLGVVFVCSGCFSVFRTLALMQKEGFDPRTIAEDMDMTWGLMESGDKEVAFVSDALCFPVDPPTLPILVSQLDRWYRGFLQCLLARRGRIRNWKLATLAYWYLADFVLGWVFLIGIFTWHTGSFAQGTVYAILIQFGVISAICSVKGVLIGKLGSVLRSLPCFFPMYFVNSFVLWRSIAFEVLLGRKLDTWSKGH